MSQQQPSKKLEPLAENEPFVVDVKTWEEWETFKATEKKPPLVYKYHPLNNHLLGLLGTGHFWYSSQNELNDPFEFRFELSRQFREQMAQGTADEFITGILRIKPDAFGNDEARWRKAIAEMTKSDDFMRDMYSMLHKDIFNWGICCFSTRRDNELMWAHYADSNKGVCLEFDLTTSPEVQEGLMPVLYDDTFPRITDMGDVYQALFRKRVAWKHEAEWRTFKMGKGPKPFNKSSLKTIYFGCNADLVAIETVKRVMAETGYTEVVRFRKANMYIDGTRISEMPQPPKPTAGPHGSTVVQDPPK